MDWIEIGKTIGTLGLIPALAIACVVLWRKWWAMVDLLVKKYDGLLARKDAVIEQLRAANEALGEKRLEEYRAMVNDYRDTLEETNKRDTELAAASHTNQRLLEQLLQRGASA